MGITHLPFQLCPGDQCGHRIDHHHVNGTRSHQGFRNFQRLFTIVRLRYQQVIDIDAQLLRIDGIQRMFGIDEGCITPGFLGFCDHMKRQGGFTGSFRSINFGNPAPG